MTAATKHLITQLHQTVNSWIDDYKAGKAKQPIIHPIIGEPPCVLDKCELKKVGGKLEVVLEYSCEEGEFGMSLSACEWRGDEVLSIGISSIRFTESGEPGMILAGGAIR